MKNIVLILLLTTLLNAKYIRDDIKEVVLDTTTKLMWQDTQDIESKTWAEAIEYCEALEFASFNNWHLPTISQLLSITDVKKYAPAIDSTFIHTRSSSYWSSTSMLGDSSYAWNVNFDDGRRNGKSDENYVRCVRPADH